PRGLSVTWGRCVSRSRGPIVCAELHCPWRRIEPPGSECHGVRHAGELTGRVGVGPDLAGEGVPDGDGVGDVRERAEEDPELAVERAAVEDLEDQLDVGLAEEPEGAGVRGEG